jgi:subtilase family serine protease
MYWSAANASFILYFLTSFAQAYVLVRMEPTVSIFSAPNWIRDETLGAQGDGRSNEVKAVFCIKRSANQRQQIEKKLIEVSTPSSPAYGLHLTKTEVQQQFSIRSEPIEIVKRYLSSQGVTNFRISPLNDLVFVSMETTQAEAILNTKFAAFHHKLFPEVRILRITKPYYLPEEVAQVVSLVDDILRFPKLREPGVRSISSPSNITVGSDEAFNSCGPKCYGATTPQVLQERYGYPTLQASTKGNSMAVVEFQFEYFDQVFYTNIFYFAMKCNNIFLNLINYIFGPMTT